MAERKVEMSGVCELEMGESLRGGTRDGGSCESESSRHASTRTEERDEAHAAL